MQVNKLALSLCSFAIIGCLLLISLQADVPLGAAAAADGNSGTGGEGIPPVTRVRVFPFNDLGMHCMDREFSVFSILPPYNVVNAQAVYRNPNGKPLLLDETYISMVYTAVQDLNGSVNSTSINKTDFWTYASQLFGVSLNPGEGLRGLYMPADAPVPGPQDMHFDSSRQWFSAEGIPITPLDDAGQPNSYPMLRVSAVYNVTGNAVGSTDVVVPVSPETDCQNCHATGEMAAVDPGISWSLDPDLEIQTKTNVLILHDHEEGTALVASQPVLCASCHYSAALDLDGLGPQGSQVGNPTMSATMHGYHGELVDGGGQPVFPPNGTVQETCYQCHPGRITECQRGAMFTGGMVCQECHGNMLSVGGKFPLLPGGSIDGTNDGNPRRPWTDMPRCQSCHTGDAVDHLSGPDLVVAGDGIRLFQAYRQGDDSASPILASNKRFAENTNTLYRFSRGHGGLACEACHGSTHAVWPNDTLYTNDNLTAYELQRHVGTVAECAACHERGTLSATATSGPHGMHNSDQRWVDKHEDVFDQNKDACRACHGLDLAGTVLGRTAAARLYDIENGQQVRFPAGTVIGCDLCHKMPD